MEFELIQIRKTTVGSCHCQPAYWIVPDEETQPIKCRLDLDPLNAGIS